MKALIYNGPEKLSIEEVEIPEITNDEILVKTKAVGICGSDLHAYQHKTARRKPPVIMGHESCGIIEKVGPSVTRFKVGDRIVPHSVIHCGRCAYCLEGNTNICSEQQVLGVNFAGCFAEYFKVPEKAVYKVPKHLSDNLATLAEPFSVGLHPVLRIKDKHPKDALVIGAGTIGLMTVISGVLSGIETIYVTDVDKDRLKYAETFGGKSYSPNDGSHVDVVFDAVGINATFKLAQQKIKAGGSIFLLGMSTPTVELDLLNTVSKEITISGSYISGKEFEIALTSLKPEMENIIGLIKPFEEAADAFKELSENRGKILKAVITL